MEHKCATCESVSCRLCKHNIVNADEFPCCDCLAIWKLSPEHFEPVDFCPDCGAPITTQTDEGSRYNI